MGQPTCSIEDCSQPVLARGWCGRHYKRWQIHGDPTVCARDRTPADRFWAKVDKAGPVAVAHLGPCWLWTARRDHGGYGQFFIHQSGKTKGLGAHRFAYEQIEGLIPEGLVLDHLCRNPPCVNPSHLEPVAQRENVLRGESLFARRAAQTRCKHGHEFTAENTHVRVNGTRQCRTCMWLRYR